MPEAPRIKHIEDIPQVPAGGVGYRLVRRELGIRAFGTNAFTADAGVQLIEEHDETGAGAGRHEELYVVIAGHARFSIDGVERTVPWALQVTRYSFRDLEVPVGPTRVEAWASRRDGNEWALYDTDAAIRAGTP